MAAKKARKRAYIPPSHEVINRRERDETTHTRSAPRQSRDTARGAARAAYEYPQPTIRRTLRRLPLYFVLIFGLQYFLSREDATSARLLQAAAQAAIVTIAFAPLMHVMDRFAYNRWLKRSGKAPQTRSGS